MKEICFPGNPLLTKCITESRWVITYTVHSGFPLYLAVSGAGPRGSNIKASIKAVSSDGLIEVPNLETEQYQNKEGIIGLEISLLRIYDFTLTTRIHFTFP